MAFSSTIIAVLINVLAQVLPWIGVTVGTEDLTNAVQVLVAIGTGLYIWWQRTLMRKVGAEQSDVAVSGVKK